MVRQHRGFRQAAQFNGVPVNAHSRVPLLKQVGHPAGHSGGHVAARGTQHHNHPTGHVLAAVIPSAFHHGPGAAVAHPETLAGPAMGKELSPRGSVQAGVAQDHVIARLQTGGSGRHDHQASAVHALAHVVVGFAMENHIQALDAEGAKALPPTAAEAQQELTAKAPVAVLGRNQPGQASPHAAVRVGNLQIHGHGAMVGHGLLQGGVRQQVIQQDGTVAMGLGIMVKPTSVIGMGHGLQQAAHVHATGFVQGDVASGQQVHAADQIVHGPQAQAADDLAHLFRHVKEEVDHMLRQPHEPAAQGFLLGGHANGALVGMAHPGHDASLGDHGHRTKSKLLSPQQGGNHHVPTGFQAAVSPQDHPLAQTVVQQAAMHFRQAQFPGNTRMLDGTEGRGAGAAVMAGNLNHVGVCLGHPGRNGANANFRHQLHRHLRGGMNLVQVMDELGQILDGIDVVVGRRRDEGHSGLAVAQPGNVGIHLGSGKLTPFPGFCPLGHLDFQLSAGAQISGSDAKAPGSHLFDGGAGRIAGAQTPQVGQGGRVPRLIHVGERPVAHRIFPAFATVALAANAVEGNGQGFMGLPGEGPQAHAPGAEAPADVVNAFHLLQGGGGLGHTELQKIPQGGGGAPLQQLLVGGEVVVARSLGKGLVERLGHLRAVEVIFAPCAVLHKAHELQLAAAQFRESLAVESQSLTGQFGEAEARHTAGGATEGCGNQIGPDAHGFKNLGAVITG